jgi:hexosaminidase
MRSILLTLLLCATLPVYAQQPTSSTVPTGAAWNLMPIPSKIQVATGQWLVQRGFSISLTGADDPRVRSAAQRFVDHLSRTTGIPLSYQTAGTGSATITIRCEHAGEKVQKLGEDESYVLDVTEGGAQLSAPNSLGVIHGLQTLLQLVGPSPQGFAAPAVHIEDSPRFPWRGLLLDACRHWMPVEAVKRTLDGMEAVKLNVLHFHLSEDQGFRIESKKLPRLHEMGSNSHYYTQEEIKELLTYGRERGIRIMPEFDMPGHSVSWFVGYPELSSGPGPYQTERRWGIFDPAMDPSRESTYKFLDKFISEMSELFPDEFFHLGGDEVNGKQWNANPEIQKFMKSHNLKSNAELQTYFTQRVVKIIEKYKKTPVGWDEVLEPDLPKNVVVQSWRGPESEAKAVQDGHRALLSNGYYLDLSLPASEHYAADPLGGDAGNLSPEQKKNILGGEACMWSEMVTPENVDSRIWPRAAAVAERLWSAAEVRDVDSMYRRLEIFSERLDMLGFTHHSALRAMQERLAPENLDQLRTLAKVVEPAKRYARSQNHNADGALNRLPDSVPPESMAARKFSLLIDRIVGGNASPDELSIARELMTAWKLNHSRLSSAFASSESLAEVGPVSEDLSRAASAGLQALDLLATRSPAPTGWVDQQMALLEPMKKPQAELLLMIVQPVQKLIQAVAKQ